MGYIDADACYALGAKMDSSGYGQYVMATRRPPAPPADPPHVLTHRLGVLRRPTREELWGGSVQGVRTL